MSLPSPHTDPRGFLLALFNAAVAQAVPGPETAAFLPAPPKGRTLVLGAGKAGGSMYYLPQYMREQSQTRVRKA